jgi:hypothetical protein
MPRFRSTGLILLTFISLLAVSILYFNDYFLQSAQMVQDDHTCACESSQKGHDPFEKPLRYIHGEFKGLCINSCSYRHTHLLQTIENGKYIVLTNLLHENEFWLAQIPIQSIQKVYILFEEFLPGINHLAMEFTINKGTEIRLLSQRNKIEIPLRKKVLQDSIIISPEAAPPTGKTYSLWDGVIGNYALMNRALTQTQYMKMVKGTDHKIRRLRVKLKPHEAQRLFVFGIRDSASVYQNQYQLLFNNCATKVIDSVLYSKNLLVSKSWDHWDVLDPLRGIPSSHHLGTIRSLEWWKLIEHPSPQASNK